MNTNSLRTNLLAAVRVPVRHLVPAGLRAHLRALPARLRSLTGGLRVRLRLVKYHVPWGPYCHISSQDRREFRPVLEAWRPSGSLPAVYICWMITEWCNYRCPYCPQTHDRFAPKAGGPFTAHVFDNHPRQKWIEAFYRHFRERRLSLKITGGESMIDKRNMVPILSALLELPTLENIRIDTNASWDPAPYDAIDKSKLILMCTFHPTQVEEEVFWERISRLLHAGFRIGMINYVMSRESLSRYAQRRQRAAELGIPLHPNPLWDWRGHYSDDDLALLKAELPEADFGYRSQLVSPQGKNCLYPAVAYGMDQAGTIGIECHADLPQGSFFDENLSTLFRGPVPCPHRSCYCLDKYSFLGEVNRNVTTNPLKIYSEILLKRPPQ
jgi:hypothetical protein